MGKKINKIRIESGFGKSITIDNPTKMTLITKDKHINQTFTSPFDDIFKQGIGLMTKIRKKK